MTTPPNVIVAHLEEGLEVIHLYSGRTVCRLYLPSPGLHVDLNGDGIPDHLVVVGTVLTTITTVVFVLEIGCRSISDIYIVQMV